MAENTLNVAAVQIHHNGSEMSEDDMAMVTEILVEDELNIPGMFVIKYTMEDFNKGEYVGVDLEKFKLGDEIKIVMGHDSPEDVLVGEITSIEPHFTEDIHLILRGFDRLHKLRFGRFRRSFTEMTDSDIISQIVSDAGLSASVESTSTTYPYVFQNNTTNYEFVYHRARRLGFEIMVKDKEFILRPSGEGEASVVTLDYQGKLMKFVARLGTITEGSSVDVRGWNFIDKKEITGIAKSGSENSKMGAGSLGFDMASEAFLDSDTVKFDEPVLDDANAEEIAKGYYNNYLKKSVTGEGECVGEPKILAGVVLTLEGLGDKFTGDYYVVSSRHIYNTREGYKTKFRVIRVGL